MQISMSIAIGPKSND